MSQNIPLTFRLSPLPDVNMTPQQFADAVVARLTAESTNTIAFFAAGSVAPTSNVGPWLKDNTTWYVWSDSLAVYVPQVIDAAALKYVAQQAPGPDNTLYTFWIMLDGTGKAQSIQYYYAAAWHDVYEDKFATYSTTTQMNTAIAAAIGGASVNTYPAEADGVNQVVPIDTFDHKIVLDTAYINPDGRFDPVTYRYSVPVSGIYRYSVYAQIDNGGGASADLQTYLGVFVNGSAARSLVGTLENANSDRWFPSYGGLLSLAVNDQVEVWGRADDGINTANVTFTHTVFSIQLVKSM